MWSYCSLLNYCVEVHVPCGHQGPHGGPGSGTQPVSFLEPMMQPGSCSSVWPALLPHAVVTWSGPELQLRTKSRSVAYAVTVCVDVRRSCYYQRPHGCLRFGAVLVSKSHTTAAVLIWVAYSATRCPGDIQTQLLQRTLSVSVVLSQPGSVLPPKITRKPRSGHNLSPCWCLGPCYHRRHSDLSGLCFHLEPGSHLGACCCRGPCLDSWS